MRCLEEKGPTTAPGPARCASLTRPVFASPNKRRGRVSLAGMGMRSPPPSSGPQHEEGHGASALGIWVKLRSGL